MPPVRSVVTEKLGAPPLHDGLLSGRGLTFVRDRQRILLRSIAVLLACTSYAPGAVAQSDTSVRQVALEAQRRAIEPRVRAFVNGSLYVDSDEGPARWSSPVCPTVLGLSADDGEFILARLSQIARQEGVPLAGEHCAEPDVYVLATMKPVEFLNKWAKMQHGRMFGDATTGAINAFIATPRPVRVWYNTRDQGDAPTSEDAPAGAEPGGIPTVPTVVTHGGDTHRVTQTLTSVILVIDKTRLQGVTRGQLADYIGMYAFSRLRTQVRPGDAPTILGLFNSVPARSPASLTGWDEAFLQALYHTDPQSALQRASIVTRMVERIVSGGPPNSQTP